jgi:hypothetical protein
VSCGDLFPGVERLEREVVHTSTCSVDVVKTSRAVEAGFQTLISESRVRFPTGAGDFSLHHRIQNGSGAHPASYPMGTSGSFHGVKQPEREADHSPPSSVEVKNAWSYTSTPPVRLHGVVLC